MTLDIKHVNERIFSCTKCEYKAKQNKTLKLHILKLHEGQIIEYRCQDCEFKTKSRGNLWRHKKTVHDGHIFSCKQCEFKTKSEGNLWRHKKSVHEDQILVFKCKLCEFTAKYHEQLKRHKTDIHENKDPLKSDQVDKAEADNTETVHLKVEKYNCEWCDMEFTQKGNVKRHIKNVHKLIAA